MPGSLHVLHVTTGLGIGGAEMMLLKFVTRSDRSRFTHAVVSLGTEGTLTPRFREAGFAVHSLDASAIRPRLAALRACIREFDPALIQGWMYHGNIAATLGHGTFARRSTKCAKKSGSLRILFAPARCFRAFRMRSSTIPRPARRSTRILATIRDGDT